MTVERCVGVFLALAALSGCGDLGLSAVKKGPLPPGGLPANQTIEGGGQVRVTSTGFARIDAAATAALAAQLTGVTLCVTSGTQSYFEYCYANDGACTPGCAVHVTSTALQLAVTNQQTMNVKFTGAGAAKVPVQSTLVSTSCVANVTIGGLHADADVAFTIDSTTGELGIHVVNVNSVTTDGVNVSGCGALGDIASVVTTLVDSVAGQFLAQALKPALDGMIASVYGSGGFAATIDVGTLLVGAATNGALMETRIVPGGNAQLVAGGLSYGVITGFNSDSDLTTRTSDLASEPSPCVAGLAPLDLSASPLSLPTTARNTFSLSSSEAFLGQPEPAVDVLVGVSEPSLDLAGHHAVASGALCLDLDETRIPSIRRDMLDDLLGVPLGRTDAPMRVALRPKQSLAFAIGDGTKGSPLLTARLPGLVMDLELGSEGGFASAVRLTTDVSEGYALETRRSTTTELEPISVSLDAASSNVEISDARYAGVSSTDAAAFLSTLVDLVFGAVGPGDTRFAGPYIAGLSVEHLGILRVQTTQASFLGITGTFGSTPPGTAAPAPAPTATTIVSSDAASVRSALRTGGAGLPSVRFTLPVASGLEHSFRIAQGAWHPYAAGTEILIQDRSFAWQGTRTIELRSRTLGDDSTTSPTTPIVVSIDYAAPTIFTDEITVQGGVVTVPARDAVSAASALVRAVGPVGGAVPTKGFTAAEGVDLGALSSATEVMVYVEDEAGHVASAKVRLRGVADGGASSDASAGDGSTSPESGPGSGGASSGGSTSTGGAATGGGATIGDGDASLLDGGTADASVASAAHPSSDGACGCRMVGAPSDTSAWALSAVVVALARRRRGGARRPERTG